MSIFIKQKNRWLELSVIMLCFFSLSYAFYLQYAQHQWPCVLCTVQRLILMAVAIMTLVQLLSKKYERIYKTALLANAFLVCTGLYFSARQIYLQHLPPDQVPACMPTFSLLLHTLPIPQLFHIILSGTGDCAKVTWRFLGLTLAEYSLLLFICLGLVFLYLILLRSYFDFKRKK